MNKRKQDQIGGHNPWEIEAAFRKERGIDPDKAETITILYWMYLGDLRPLAAAIGKGHQLDQAVLNRLARMIYEDRLIVKPLKDGRPKSPSRTARDIVAAELYEKLSGKSKAKLKHISELLGISEQTVAQAVTRIRKAEGKANNK